MEINYTVELTLPAVTASLDVIGKDINIVVKRDDEGFPIFSAKHIKGIFRKKVYLFKKILEEKKGRNEVEKITNDFVIKEIKKLLLDVGFEDIDRILNSYPNELSGGMRQRIAIVLVLCTDIKILLADEPTTSLDVVNQFRFIELLKKISKEKGLTLIYVSHDIKVLSKICERIIVLKDGNIIEENDTMQILKEPKNDYTKLLIKAATAD